jgi:hypothetical protein
MYLNIDIPFLSLRDFCAYGFAVNDSKESRTILVCCKSIDDDKNTFKDKYIPPKEGFVRGNINMFNFSLHLKSKTKLTVKAVISIDPKIGLLPQSMVDFGTKQFVMELFKQISRITKIFEVWLNFLFRALSIKIKTLPKLIKLFMII